MNKLRVDWAYDATWTIRVRGRTQGDGEVLTVTSQMIKDKVQYLLDQMLKDGKIQGYQIGVTFNNIKEAEETLRKAES